MVALAAPMAAYALLAGGHALTAGAAAHGAAAPLSAAAALLALLALAQLRSTAAAAAVIIAALTAQIFWALSADTQPFGAAGALWADAIRLARLGDVGALAGAPAPAATAFWAGVVALFGEGAAPARIAAALLWTLQIWLVWRIAKAIPETAPAALGAAALFGLAPASIVYAGVIGGEALFGALSLGAVLALLSHRRRGLFVSVGLSGAMIGVSLMISALGAAYLLALTAALLIAALRARAARSRRRYGAAAAALWLTVGAALLGGIGASGQRLGEAADRAIDRLGYQLLIGANRENAHGYSVGDLTASGLLTSPEPGEASHEDAPPQSPAAMAWSRVAEDPLGFIGFALGEKMRRLWASEAEAIRWSAAGPSPSAAPWTRAAAEGWLRLAADAALIAGLALTALGAAQLLMRSRAVKDPSRWAMILTAALALALSFLAIEARERLHGYFMPLFAVAAGYGLAELTRAAQAITLRRGAQRLWRALPRALAALRRRASAWAPMTIARKAPAPPKPPAPKRPPEPARADPAEAKTRLAPVRS